MAALQTAIVTRRPPAGCVHHSDRGGQYAAEKYRALMSAHGFIDSMCRRGNPYDNAKAETFLKTLKAEAVHQTENDSFEEVAADLPRFLDDICIERRLHSALGYRSPAEFEWQHAQEGAMLRRRPVPPSGVTPPERHGTPETATCGLTRSAPAATRPAS